MPDPSASIPLALIRRTWWPLAASWLLMSAELPLLTAVVARLPEPRIHLAAYGGVVFPLALIIEAPVIMLLAASTALSRDSASYRKIRRFMMWTSAGLTALHVALALTPLYHLVVVGLLGAPAAIVEPARIGLIIMTPWTWSIAYRRFNQGVLIRFGRSGAVGVGTVVRLGTVTAVLTVGYLLRWPGIVVATAAVSAGVVAEAIYTRFVVRPVVLGPLARSPVVSPALTRSAFRHFYLPLVLTSLLMLLAQPIGSAAMSRMPQALASLAAWSAVGGLLFMLRSAGMAFNEVVVALADRPRATAPLWRFARILMISFTALALVLAATPLAGLWFGAVMGLGPELADLARRALWLGVPLVALTVLQSWYQGILVNARRTRAISEAVAVYLVVNAALLGAGVMVGRIAGLYVAVAAMTVAATVQSIWLWRWSRGSLAALRAQDEADPGPPGPGVLAPSAARD